MCGGDVLGIGDWVGSWEVGRRENWEAFLNFSGVPAANHEAAIKAVDFHRYRMDEGSWVMDHRIPVQGLHLHFRADFDGALHDCPYPRPTVKHWAQGDEGAPAETLQWKNTWVKKGTHFRTEILDFFGKGKTFVLERELITKAEIECTLNVRDGDAVVVGPCKTRMVKTGDAGPAPLEYLRKKGKPLDTAEAREAALEQAFKMFAENIDEFTAAQTADRVSPCRFDGPARMLMGAAKYYQALVPGWMQPEKVGDTTPDMLKMGVEADFYAHNEPKGTGVVIAPWNAPALLAAVPTLGMLAAGNHVVIKPSETTPTVSALLRRLCQKYLHGLVWVEEGARDAVERLIDEGPDHLCFTGGGEIAKLVAAKAAQHLTPVTLELGGKSPVFIDKGLGDGMMDKVVKEILITKQAFSGQFCCAHDYVLVHSEARDAFVEKLRGALEELGEGRSVPLNNRRQYERVKAMLLEADGEKVPALAGAHVPVDSAMTLPVTAILQPSPEKEVLRHEIFGPLLPVLVVEGVDEAIAQVNSAATGKALIAYCYSEDAVSVEKFLACTSSGNVCVNAGYQRMLGNYHVGFGGVGGSGCGVSMWGKEALREFSNRKFVCRARDGFASSLMGGPPPKGKGKGDGKGEASAASSGGAVGQVQKAFAGGGGKGKGKADDKPPLEGALAALTEADAFKQSFGGVFEAASPAERKLMAVRAMLPYARKQVQTQAGATTAKRAAILNGYRDFAEKKGIPWRADAKELEDRGMETWEAELEQVTDKTLRTPDYYEFHGQKGALHSYATGNCNWEAAFDAPSAYMLVHLHHYPNLTPQECFDRLHADLDVLALGALSAGQGETPLQCVDVGCGVGTSTFSLLRSLRTAGRPANVTGVDLSPHFVAVAEHLRMAAGVTEGLSFKHGDGLDLARAGFGDASVDYLCVSEVTHELPIEASRRLWRETARALRPGGVVGFMDLNPVQILRDNQVAALVTRIAMENEPYFDDYLELDMPEAMREAGLEVVEESWPAKETWKTAEDASLRLIVARKPLA